jgi:hypothetical protein
MNRPSWQLYRQVYRHESAVGRPLLARPDDDPTRRVWLQARPGDLARASISAGRARFPVDPAIWLCCEALCAVELDELDDALAAVKMPRDERVPAQLGRWLVQLRAGSGWHEPQLPQITMPGALADQVNAAIMRAAVRVAADPARLRAVLGAEEAAVCDGGRRLGQVLLSDAAPVRRSAAA